MGWTNVLIDKNRIIAKTNRAVLVKESDWMVWISWKVVRKGSEMHNFSAGINSEREYRV